MCDRMKVEQKKRKTYNLLQQKQVTKLDGYSCQVTKSSFLLYCGAWSHTKMAKIPKIEINQMVGTRDCENYLTTSVFKTLEGSTHRIKLNEETIFSVTEKGLIHDSSSGVTCKGEQMRIGQEIVDNILQMSQYKVTIREEELLAKGQEVEVLTDHTKLSCPARRKGCITGEKTYYWENPVQACALEKIREIEVDTKGDDYIVDHTNKIIFNKTGIQKSPSGCPIADLITTEYENLFLTTSTEFAQSVDILDIQNYINNRDNYITYTMEERLNQLQQKTQSNFCQLRYQTEQIIQVESNLFAKITGDTVLVFGCLSKKAKIETLTTCMADIPINTGQFVNPQTRVMVKTSPQKECNKHFPMIIESEEGWISINPSLVPVSPPLTKDFVIKRFAHESLSHGGIYTDEEVKAWESLIEYSSFHTALSQSITYGVCLHEGKCEQAQINPVPTYNLQNLIDPLKEELSWFRKIDEAIKLYSGYIGIIVILGWIFKLIIWISAFTTILLKEGTSAAIALFFSTICFSAHQMKKISRRAKQNRTKIPTPDYDEAVPMNPYGQTASF